MEESTRPEPALRRPGAAAGAGSVDADPATLLGPPHLADPRALTILSTEHWSLLTSRSLVYNESFSRGGMFLTFLSASLVALGFISQGAVGPELPWVVLLFLALDLFVGLATMGRLISASSEEFRALQAMNRIRHAYLEMVPTLEPYFSTAHHDDVRSVLDTYGESVGQEPFALSAITHGLTTMPGLVGVLDAALAGAIAATVVGILGASSSLAIVAAVVAALVMTLLLFRLMGTIFHRQERYMAPRFPPPTPPRG